MYVEGTDHNLWLEATGWWSYGRTFIDSSVESFAVYPSPYGYLYVEGTDHNLWLEGPNWHLYGRTWVDSSVESFAVYP